MSRLDELPPDQRAALSLLLRQRKSYGEVAAMLGIAEQAVHDRAHAALAVLAPSLARELTPERRREVGDYLLGQQASVADRLRARTYLSSSAAARAWAQALSGELAPLSDSALPEIPPADAGATPGAIDTGSVLGAAGSTSSGDSESPSFAPARSLPSSRVGGALLLAAIVAAVVVAIVLLTNGGSGGHKASAGASAKASGTTTGPTISARLPLRAPSSTSRSVGLVQILSEGSKRAFYVVAEQLPATRGFFYALWLYNSPTSHEPLGKAPPVGSTHHLEGGGALPADAGSFGQVLLTRETSTHATQPGRVILSGRFSLSG
jgi:hypothetical protein